MFAITCNFTFIPVNEDFKSTIQNLEKSNTPFPSEHNLLGIAGFILVPSFIDTKEILYSPWMRQFEKDDDVREFFEITANPKKDGLILMNYDPSIKSNNPFSLGSVKFKKTAEVKGFAQNYGIYLKTGSAFILESLMKNREWDKQKIGDVDVRKISNGFPENITIAKEFWEGLDFAVLELKELFSNCGKTGFDVYGETKEKYDKEIYSILSLEYELNPSFIQMLAFDIERIESLLEFANAEMNESFAFYLQSVKEEYYSNIIS